MADDATLTIRFRDESSPGAGAGAAAPQPGASQSPTDYVTATQQAITAAGGVGNYTTRSGSGGVAPVTPVVVSPAAGAAVPNTASVTTTATDPQEALLNAFLQKVSQREGNLPAETLLGIGVPAEDVVNTLHRTRLLQSTEPLRVPEYDAEIRDIQSMAAISADYDAEVRRVQAQDRADELAARMRQQDELDRVLNEAKYNIPRPAALTREQLLDEAGRIAPPIQGEEEQGAEYERPDVSGLHRVLNQVAGLAAYAGPEGAIAARIAQTVTPFAAEAGGALGLAGTAAIGLGVAAAGVAGAIGTIAAVNSYVDAKTGQMASVSGAITVAAAHAEVREFMRTLDSANKIGELAAVNIDAEQRLADVTKETRDTFNAYATAFIATLKGGLADLFQGKEFTPEGLAEQRKINEELRKALEKINGGNKFGFSDVTPYKPGDLLFITPEIMDPFADWARAAAKSPQGMKPADHSDPGYSAGGVFGMW